MWTPHYPDNPCSGKRRCTGKDRLISDLYQRAEELGFIGIGFSRPERLSHFDRFAAWLSKGHHAGMTWLERNTALREDPSKLLPNCRCIISLAYPYSSKKPATPDGLFASRYSEPTLEDYHQRLKRLCSVLVKMIKRVHGTGVNRIFVDSAPVLERSIAYKSGIGFIGKNAMLIIPGHGSYFYLAEIFSTAAMEIPSVTPVANLCSSCSRCLDACPKGAIEEGSSLDASKCLSYWTIESKETLSVLGREMGHCFFGCDRCQEACPHNREKATSEVSLPSTEEFLCMRDEEFEEKFGRTALSRAGLEKIKSNIKAVRGKLL
jgi:epoxyqueuosine reductase